MSLSIELSNPAAGSVLASPSKQAVIDTVRASISIVDSAGPGGGTVDSFVMGSALPAPADHDKLWFRLGSGIATGAPLGFYRYWYGRWTPVASDAIGAVKFVLFDFDPRPFFGSDRKGLFDAGEDSIAGAWYGWKLLVDDARLQGHFLALAKTGGPQGSGYRFQAPDRTGASQSHVDDPNTVLTLDPAAIPNFTVHGTLAVTTPTAGTANRVMLTTQTEGEYDAAVNPTHTPTPVAVPYPPYAVMCPVQFVGYTY